MRLLLCFVVSSIIVGCTWVGVTPQGVVVDIPPRPSLSTCPPIPHPEGEVVAGGVLLSMENAIAIRDYLSNGPRCYEESIIILNGHITKLENRLKAVKP